MKPLRFPHVSLKYLALLIVIVGVVSAEVGYSYIEGLHSRPSGSGTSPGSGGSSGSSGNSDSHRSCIPMTGTSYVEVTALLNYGNGTSKWYNNTRVPSGWDFYNLTLFVADCHVEAEYYPIYKAHFIVGIDGVRSNDPFYWTLWIYCTNDRAWSVSQLGADLIQLGNGDVIAWFYQNTSGTWQPPVQGARTVAQCS